MPCLTDAEAIAFHNRIASDPVFFHREILGEGLTWEKQTEIITAPLTHRRIVVKGGHNVGKGYAIATVGLWFLYSGGPGSILVTTAPTGRQIKTLLWGEIRRKWIHSKMRLDGQLDMLQLKMDDDWYAVGFSTDEPYNVSGYHAKRVMVIIDEAQGIADEIMNEMEGLVSGDECWLILAGNPMRASGRFYDDFKDPAYKKITLSCLDHPNVKTGKTIFPGMVSREWVEERKRKWGEKSPLYQAKVLGEFPEQDTSYIIHLDWVEKAKETRLKAEGLVEAGLDIAEMGSDETVLIIRQGKKVLAREVWSHKDLMETCGLVVNLIKKYGVKVLMADKVGIGSGVVSRLKELNPCDIIGVSASERAKDPEQFFSKRDELWIGLADRFKAGEIDCSALNPDDELFSQITSIKELPVNSKGQRKIESKDDMRRRGLPSPDRGDALCLAFAGEDPHPVKEKEYPPGTLRLGDLIIPRKRYDDEDGDDGAGL